MRKDNSKMRRRSFGTAMGITSIIAILVILVLVVFSALSLITAKADLNLSQKTADTIKSYYTADDKAETIIAEFGDIMGDEEAGKINDEDFARYSGAFTDGKDYSYDSGDNILKFTVPIDDSRELKVEVQYKNNGQIEEKLLWQVIPSNEWQKDDSLQLFQP